MLFFINVTAVWFTFFAAHLQYSGLSLYSYLPSFHCCSFLPIFWQWGKDNWGSESKTFGAFMLKTQTLQIYFKSTQVWWSSLLFGHLSLCIYALLDDRLIMTSLQPVGQPRKLPHQLSLSSFQGM